MIKFECETCFQEYKVRDERAGQVLKCKACGQKMRVPSGDDDLLDDVYEDYEAPARPTRKKKSAGASKGSAKKKKKSSGKNSNPAINLIVGVISFAVAFYLSYTFVRGLSGDKEKNGADNPPAMVDNDLGAGSSPEEPAAAPAAQSGLSPDEEFRQLSKQMGEYAQAGKEAKTEEEKKEIFEKMKSTQARMKALSAKRKAARALATLNVKTAPVAQEWTSRVDPPQFQFSWPENSQLQIDLEGIEDKRIVPSSPSPFIGLRHDKTDPFQIDVWNLATAEKVGSITVPVEQNQRVSNYDFCLSANGKYYLMSFVSKDSKTPSFASWDVTTGKKVAEWEASRPDSHIANYEIVGSDKVFAKVFFKDGGKFKNILRTWDLATGKLIKEKEIKSNDFSGINYKISPGGKYIFINKYSKFSILDLSSLEIVYEGEFKTLLPGSFDYISVLAMEFSPDGRELGLLTSGNHVTSVWTLDLSQGKGVLGYEVPGSLNDALNEPTYEGSDLTWNPDGESWMLYGACLVDRKRKEILWYLKPAPNVIMRPPVILTPNYLLVETDSALTDEKGRLRLNTNSKLVPMELPVQQLTESLAAYNSENAALVTNKGQQVSIEVDTGKLKFGNADAVQTVLAEVIQKRLEFDGFQVAPDQPIVFKVEYQEQDGNKLQMSKRGPPTPGNPLGRTPTGQTLQTTAAVFKLSWIEKATNRTIWSKEASVNPQVMVLRDATEQGAQKQMFERLQNRLMAESIPYFIPQDKNLSSLPMVLTPPD